jgi:hypothetical protein
MDIAFKEIGLMPDQFWRMTPTELWVVYEAHREREIREYEKWAWIIANLVQPHTRKKVKPEYYFDRKKAEKKLGAREELKEKIKRIKELQEFWDKREVKPDGRRGES